MIYFFSFSGVFVGEKKKSFMKKITEMCRKITVKKAIGFKCDLKECPSTLMECSVTSCTKPEMLFTECQKAPKVIKRTKKKKEDVRVICVQTCDRGTDNDLLILVKDQAVGMSCIDKQTSTCSSSHLMSMINKQIEKKTEKDNKMKECSSLYLSYKVEDKFKVK